MVNGGRCRVPEPSILAGVGDVINEALGLKDSRFKYKHKKACQLLSEGIGPAFDAKALIGNILAQVKRNRDQTRLPSDKNWRWEKHPEIDSDNRSPEVKLERQIVRSSENDWVNQVPVSSGLAGSGDRRRAIDLVHRCGGGWYELIELKVGSDTPLFAAMEILQYGVLFIFSRKYSEKLGYTEKHEYDEESIKMLNAPGIHLKVMAPTTYYAGYHLQWLKEAINTGFDRFMAGRGYKMDFEFESFDLSCSPALIPARSPVKWKRA